MGQRWYQKASVQSAMVTGGCAVAASLITFIAISPETTRLKNENQTLHLEIDRLNAEMIPFKTEALRRYPGDEKEALAKLAFQLNTVATSVEIMRDYSDMARLNAFGKPYEDGDIIFNTPTSSMLEGTYRRNGDKYVIRHDQDAELVFRSVIARFPRFPFAYYFLALCLKDKDEPNWKLPAQQAVELLQKTTQIAGHDAAHDEVLAKLGLLLRD